MITGILYDTLDHPRFFRNFYIRRTLRIFPLFYAIWIFFLLLTTFVTIEWNRYVFAQMFYVGNFTVTSAALGRHPDPGVLQVAGYPFIFGHYRTLCLEEQFYLVWPLIVFLARSRLLLFRIAIATSVAVLALRCVLVVTGSGLSLYNTSYTRVDSLLIGAALVLWLRGKDAGYHVPVGYCLALFLIPAVILGTLVFTVGRHWGLETGNPVFGTVGFTLLAVSSCGLILASLQPDLFLYKVFTFRGLIALGTVSYGF